MDDFDGLTSEFVKLGIEFDDEHLSIHFLSRIIDKNKPGGTYFNFYHNMRILKEEERK